MDYVLRMDSGTAAIEVKSADVDSISGIHEFRRRYPQSKTYLIGGQGMSLESFFAVSAAELL